MVSAARVLIPQPQVKVDGRPLTTAQSGLRRVTVTTEVNVPGMFTLELTNTDLLPGEKRWADDQLFNIGNPVEIRATSPGGKLLIEGEITGLEPEYYQDQVPTLLVRGYDRRHRLMRGQKTRSFTDMKDSNIALQVAQTAGLQVVATDTRIQLDYVLQYNQTDLAFLQTRASRIGYELTMEGKQLGFHPITKPQGSYPTVKLAFPDTLQRFSPRLSSLNQVGKVYVTSWDAMEKAPIIGQNAGGGPSVPLGDVSGAREAVKSFGQADQVRVDQPVFSRGEADQMARGQLIERALEYVTGEGQCRGDPDLQAGCIVDIQGVGKRFGGRYYVTAATHVFGPHQGYTTEFSFKRNAHNWQETNR